MTRIITRAHNEPGDIVLGPFFLPLTGRQQEQCTMFIRAALDAGLCAVTVRDPALGCVSVSARCAAFLTIGGLV
jgi:hypothetical protein